MNNENLWAPWRWDYIHNLDPAPSPGNKLNNSKNNPAGESPPPARCFLCDAARTDPGSPEAAQRLVLAADDRGVLLLNRYPYANGHLLVAPAGHFADLTELTPAQQHGLMDLVVLGQNLLNHAINPQGFNIGINIGRASGAGVPGHLHVHVVPRWSGDTNFMTVVGRIRIIPQALDHSYQTLSEMIKNVKK